ncbi:hypothetical protein SHA02_16100 [Salisediminibacterium halotolerans]|nr:hypothetical protein SHA02_16100 [Salisediminibacterium halotolerans]
MIDIDPLLYQKIFRNGEKMLKNVCRDAENNYVWFILTSRDAAKKGTGVDEVAECKKKTVGDLCDPAARSELNRRGNFVLHSE